MVEWTPAVALVVLALPLAGCLEPEVTGPGGSACCGPPEGDPGDGDPVAAEEFQPDLLRLKRDFCANHTLELPAPRFGSLQLTGVEDRLYDGPMPCTVILDPATTDAQRNRTSVFIDIVGASSSGVVFTIESYSTASLGEGTVYGSVDFTAPEGPWGPAGRYDVGYDPREEDGRIVARWPG